MSDKTSLGDRENITRYYLPRRIYTILRIDGPSSSKGGFV